ncbi:9787_t:CDS:2 [Racocetra fulgida]|uniref:9787_t:CDS:1 n=1 Tax=Racocetra fulgida TaxID=60492 RepID=A0A9N9GKW5_9GLOM|nr:9787_t:CDS:2 [Racocetra fulgida]
MNTYNPYKFVIVDNKAKGPAIKEKSSKPSKPASVTMTSVSSDGKKTTEDRKNEEIIQKNVETIKKEDQEPETKPREKTPTTNVASVVTAPTNSDSMAISNNVPLGGLVKRMFSSKKSSQPQSPVAKTPTTISAEENATPEDKTNDKTNEVSINTTPIQEDNDKKIEETEIIEKEEIPEPAERDIKQKSNEEIEEEVTNSDKKPKTVVKGGNVRDFFTRCIEKLQQEFDELDRRMYSGVPPPEVTARDIPTNELQNVDPQKSELQRNEHHKLEREQLLERADTESDVQPNVKVNGDARSALADAGEALNERGEKLGELNERIGALGGASAEFARLAADIRKKEANKKWYQQIF